MNTLPDLPWHKFTSMKTLDLDGNNLEVIPSEIAMLINLQTVSLAGNPLRSIPKRFRTNWPTVSDYLRLVGHQAAQWKHRKLLLVGQEGVGKSNNPHHELFFLYFETNIVLFYGYQVHY
jgi:Leucine-rich repeat (LRR) protein